MSTSASPATSVSLGPKLRSCFKRNSLPPPASPSMSMPPKSCLKRNSLPPSPRPLFLDGPRSASPAPVFEDDEDDQSFATTDSDAASQDTAYSASAGTGARPRAKSVSFSEEDDVFVFYPITDPLHLQARKQVARLFKACAEALKIDHPPPQSDTPWRHSHSGYAECVLLEVREEPER